MRVARCESRSRTGTRENGGSGRLPCAVGGSPLSRPLSRLRACEPPARSSTRDRFDPESDGRRRRTRRNEGAPGGRDERRLLLRGGYAAVAAVVVADRARGASARSRRGRRRRRGAAAAAATVVVAVALVLQHDVFRCNDGGAREERVRRARERVSHLGAPRHGSRPRDDDERRGSSATAADGSRCAVAPHRGRLARHAARTRPWCGRAAWSAGRPASTLGSALAPTHRAVVEGSRVPRAADVATRGAWPNGGWGRARSGDGGHRGGGVWKPPCARRGDRSTIYEGGGGDREEHARV